MEILFDIKNETGIINLNRPRALNALLESLTNTSKSTGSQDIL